MAGAAAEAGAPVAAVLLPMCCLPWQWSAPEGARQLRCEPALPPPAVTGGRQGALPQPWCPSGFPGYRNYRAASRASFPARVRAARSWCARAASPSG
ncbi:hypothetical protein HOK021_20510 [Streptomyces hygroscopicus]|nr:hypothetical protein HOK021_20510 [Streptomyces hygroscopicus]